MAHLTIQVKRAYEPPVDDDGLRVLVDRIWPRGRTKEELKIDHWMKSLAPSTALRRWFNHDPQKWAAFKKRYFSELDERQDELAGLLEHAGDGRLTLVFGARDEKHNNAVALREYLTRMQQ